MPGETGSQTIRSVIDSPENSPIVAITNVSTTVSQTLHVSCLPSTGKKIEKTVGIQPKQTKLIRTCSSTPDGVFSADAIDDQFNLRPESNAGMSEQGVAGVSITTDGPPGEIAAFGFVEHDDSFGRYFSAMNFADPQLLHSSGFVFAGVPVGDSHLLPSAYAPQVAVTNFSAKPETVNVYLATSSDGASSQKEVAAFSMPPGSSRLVDLKGLSGSADWQNSFVVRSTGRPGEVMSKMMFKAAGLLPNIEVMGKDEQHTQTAGDHPWSVENGMRSTLYLFNHSSSKKEVTVRLGSGTDIWLKMYDLQPNETRAISINDVLQSRIPDMKGHAFPTTKTTGEAAWWSPSGSSPQVSGRVVQINAAGDMARNFSCYNYEGICALSISADPFELVFGGDLELGSDPSFCMYPGPPGGNCSNDGQYAPSGTSLNWSWSSANSNIAAIMSGASTAISTWQGMAGGSTRSAVTAYVSSNTNSYCQAGGWVDVQTPSSLKVLSATYLPSGTSGNYGCLPGYYGFEIDVKYQVLDQSKTAISNASMTPQELTSGNTTYTNIGPSRISDTSKNTASDGTFHDAPVGQCGIAPFTATETQKIQILLNGQAFPVRSQTYTFKGTNAGAGSVSNGSDINVTH